MHTPAAVVATLRVDVAGDITRKSGAESVKDHRKDVVSGCLLNFRDFFFVSIHALGMSRGASRYMRVPDLTAAQAYYAMKRITA
jgi:hypothetical protein